MTTFSKAILLSSLALLSGCIAIDTTDGDNSSSAAQSSVSSDQTTLIMVENPHSNQLIESPFVVRGEARGNWYFEASFPVKLLDADGKELVVTYAQAEGDWMTTEFVPFSSTLTFEEPETPTGTLVLEKDNPSGLPENDDKIEIPVRFR